MYAYFKECYGVTTLLVSKKPHDIINGNVSKKQTNISSGKSTTIPWHFCV